MWHLSAARANRPSYPKLCVASGEWANGSVKTSSKDSPTRRCLVARGIRACSAGSAVATNARRSCAACGIDARSVDVATIMNMHRARYRFRTWLRGSLPDALARLVPKGRHDCGAHEWYRADRDVWRCYHCEPGIARVSPWTREEQLQRTFGAISTTLRLFALRGGPGSEQDLDALRRMVGEALAALPEEERRLERLAAAPAEELPGIVKALRTA